MEVLENQIENQIENAVENTQPELETVPESVQPQLETLTESYQPQIDAALDVIANQGEIQYILLEMSDRQIQQIEIQTEIKNLMFFSIVAIGVLLIFILLWRVLRVFV